MLNAEKKITIEWIAKKNNKNEIEKHSSSTVSNPVTSDYSDTDKLSLMISKILHEELPMLENNSLLRDLVMYSLLEKMKTVQSVENVLSYIKDSKGKEVKDVSFKNGEVCIKCSI